MSLEMERQHRMFTLPGPTISALERASAWEAFLTPGRRGSPVLLLPNSPLVWISQALVPVCSPALHLPCPGTCFVWGKYNCGHSLAYVCQKTTSDAVLSFVRQALFDLELCQVAHELPGRHPSPLPPSWKVHALWPSFLWARKPKLRSSCVHGVLLFSCYDKIL